jgi:simple sugar transport system permease protein
VIDDTTFILGSASRLAAPLLFVALGELLAERAGALNISVEAMMLGSAYSAALASDATGSPLGGLVVGVATGVAVAVIQAVLSHWLTFNQFVVGLTLNLLVLGLTSYLFAQVDMEPEQFGELRIPGLAAIPIVGDALFEQRWPFYSLYLLVPAVWWVLHRSRWGLELHAVGDDPVAADVSGVAVNGRRRQAIVACGALAGLGGAHLSVGVVGSFSQNMTAGRGFIAIAAVIFGGWTLWGTVAGCFVFGGADALRLALPAIGLTLNPQLLISAPYLLALTAMVFVARGRRQPSALGRGYRRAFT